MRTRRRGNIRDPKQRKALSKQYSETATAHHTPPFPLNYKSNSSPSNMALRAAKYSRKPITLPKFNLPD